MRSIKNIPNLVKQTSNIRLDGQLYRPLGISSRYHVEAWVRDTPDQRMTPDMQRYIDRLSRVRPVKVYCFLSRNYQPIYDDTLVFDKWIPISKTKNALMEDHLSDYLEQMSDGTNGENKDTIQRHFINRGIQFERKVIQELLNMYPNVCTTIGESYQANSYDKHQDTLRAMKANYAFIFQAVLWNFDNLTFGCADMLVRSDYLIRLLNVDYVSVFPHYVVVDVKLNHDSDLLPFIKGQLYLYNRALGNMQGYTPECSFIWSRTGISAVRMTGDIAATANDAVRWLQDIERIDESDAILLPNMKSKNVSKFKAQKKDIAKKTHELTQLWNVTTKHRQNALDVGISSLQHPLLCADVLGITGEKKKGIVDALIKGYQSWDMVSGNITNFGGWMTNEKSYYLDIETINMNMFSDVPISDAVQVFMIGVGWMESSEWKYEVVTATDLTLGEEERILRRLVELVGDVSTFHWGAHERTVILPKLDKYNISHTLCLFDMNKWFMDETIVIKGMLDFKLKTVVEAMRQNYMTKLKWGDMDNGLDAMYTAWKIYQGREDKDAMNNIVAYNENDCHSLCEIHKVLRQYV
jgi:uncharacterized protein YprB with RNaseH-like and TPR domain